MKSAYISFLFCLLFPIIAKADKTVTQPDSILNTEYITNIYLSEPRLALHLLDSAEASKTIPDFRINHLRSMVYGVLNMPRMGLHYGKLAYENDSVRQNDLMFLKMSNLLINLTQRLDYHEESITYATAALDIARKTGNIRDEADVLFCLGKSQYAQGQRKEAYASFAQAEEVLKKADNNVRILALQSYFYGEEMRFLLHDKEYDKAIALGIKRKKLIDRMSTMEGPPIDYIDQQYGFLYSKMAYTYAITGKKEKAGEMWRKYQDTKYSKTLNGIREGTPALIKMGQYEEAIRNSELLIRQYRLQDTLNNEYVGLLQNEVEALLGKGDYRRAFVEQKTITSVMDSINVREKRNAALELLALHNSNEKDAQIERNAVQLRNRLIMLICTLVVLFVLALLFWRSKQHGNIIRYKNRIMAERIKELLAQRDELRSTQQQLRKQSEPEETIKNSDTADDESNDIIRDEDKEIFENINHIMLAEYCYLRPEFARDDLIKIAGVGRNRLSQIIRLQTGTGVSGYINNLRIDYATKQLTEHPEYTIQAVASDSGFMNVRTFQRLFRERTGMSPAEYKAAISQ